MERLYHLEQRGIKIWKQNFSHLNEKKLKIFFFSSETKDCLGNTSDNKIMYLTDVETLYKKEKRTPLLMWTWNFDFAIKSMSIFMRPTCFTIVDSLRKKGNRVKRDNLGPHRK